MVKIVYIIIWINKLSQLTYYYFIYMFWLLRKAPTWKVNLRTNVSLKDEEIVGDVIHLTKEMIAHITEQNENYLNETYNRNK